MIGTDGQGQRYRDRKIGTEAGTDKHGQGQKDRVTKTRTKEQE